MDHGYYWLHIMDIAFFLFSDPSHVWLALISFELLQILSLEFCGPECCGLNCILPLIPIPGFSSSSVSKLSACNAGYMGSIPGLGRSPGEGNGNPLQYPCLENSMDRGAWQATVHGVTKSWTWLTNTYTHLPQIHISPNPLYFRMWLHLKIRYLKR